MDFFRQYLTYFSSLRCLWSDGYHPEQTSDQTIPRLKWSLIILLFALKGPMITPFPSGSDLWSYYPHPEATSDHTIPIRKRPLIVLSPSGSDLWSYYPHPETTSDHTFPRPKVTPDQTVPIRKRPLIRPFPCGSDLWSDHSHPEPNPRPCNYGLGTHRVRWAPDDQRSLPDGTSTWGNLIEINLLCNYFVTVSTFGAL